jgi:alpha-galactosidase
MSLQAAEFTTGKIVLRYLHETESGVLSLQILPASLDVPLHKWNADSTGLQPSTHAAPPQQLFDPVAQVKIMGDPYPGSFCTGHSMLHAPFDPFFFEEQRVEKSDLTTVVTTLRNSRGHRLVHFASWKEGASFLRVHTIFRNDSEAPVTLEMLTSFSICGLAAFDPADAPNRLVLHRYRSGWSAEGRHDQARIEDLHLERSWSGTALFSERFGQVGSMPVRKWFPFAAVEDTQAGVIWGAHLAWGGSWQIELVRQYDDLALTGGLADREFGHWTKTLAPGESLATPPAFLSCVRGSLEDLCNQLVEAQADAANSHPEIERDLPIVYNDWCTSWGNPDERDLLRTADRLRGSEVRYFVIDAGWYKQEAGNWSNAHGDWEPSSKLYPEGLAATARKIRDLGFIPGLWFEIETVGSQSEAFHDHDRLLKRDGVPLTVCERRFWDLRKPEVVEYLADKMLSLLRQGFGYVKVDYNETIGLGADDPDGLGEGLRKTVVGAGRLFEILRKEMPELVIEGCSSGGHRLEPSFIARAAMSSFSDAHYHVEIPIIASALHRHMLPRQCQVWAVLRKKESLQRITYSLAATFLGRMCLSGDVSDLSSEQWGRVLEAQALYRKAAPVIRDGTSRMISHIGASWRHPEGWQALVRTGSDERSILLVLHAFENAPDEVCIDLPHGAWEDVGQFLCGECGISENQVKWRPGGDWQGGVLLLARK